MQFSPALASTTLAVSAFLLMVRLASFSLWGSRAGSDGGTVTP